MNDPIPPKCVWETVGGSEIGMRARGKAIAVAGNQKTSVAAAGSLARNVERELKQQTTYLGYC